jgi:hypothetical protein
MTRTTAIRRSRRAQRDAPRTMPAFALAHALASAPLAIRRRDRAAAVARAPSSSAPAAVVRSRATTRRRRSAGGVRCDAAGGDEAASSSSKKDVDWEQKTREMTAERVMEACMEAMAEGDESKLDACLLELEDPTAKRGVVDDLLDRKKGEGDEFWAAKLRAIAAERVLENCMEAVVRRGAARSVVVSNPVTRRSVAARVDRTPRRRGRSLPSGGCYFLNRSDTAFFFPSRYRSPAPPTLPSSDGRRRGRDRGLHARRAERRPAGRGHVHRGGREHDV